MLALHQGISKTHSDRNKRAQPDPLAKDDPDKVRFWVLDDESMELSQLQDSSLELRGSARLTQEQAAGLLDGGVFGDDSVGRPGFEGSSVAAASASMMAGESSLGEIPSVVVLGASGHHSAGGGKGKGNKGNKGNKGRGAMAKAKACDIVSQCPGFECRKQPSTASRQKLLNAFPLQLCTTIETESANSSVPYGMFEGYIEIIGRVF